MACFLLGRHVSVLVVDYDQTPPLPVFSLVAFTWARGGRRNNRELTSGPSDSLAHGFSLLAPTFLHHVPTCTLFTDASIYVEYTLRIVVVFGEQELKKKNEPARPNLHLTRHKGDGAELVKN